MCKNIYKNIFLSSIFIMLAALSDVCNASDFAPPHNHKSVDVSSNYKHQSLDQYTQSIEDDLNASDAQTEYNMAANRAEVILAVNAASAGKCNAARNYLLAAHEKMTTTSGQYASNTALPYLYAQSIVDKECPLEAEESPPSHQSADSLRKHSKNTNQEETPSLSSATVVKNCGHIVDLAFFPKESHTFRYFGKDRSHRNAFPAVMSDQTCGYTNNMVGTSPVMTGTLSDKIGGEKEFGTYSCWCDVLDNGVKTLRVTASLTNGTNWAGYGGATSVQVFPTNEPQTPSKNSGVSCRENEKFYADGASYTSTCSEGGYGTIEHTCTNGEMVINDSCRYDGCIDKTRSGVLHPNGTQWLEEDACNEVHSDGSYKGNVKFKCDNGQVIYVHDWCTATSVSPVMFPNSTECTIPNASETIKSGFAVSRNCYGYYGYTRGTITFACSQDGEDAKLNVSLGTCK